MRKKPARILGPKQERAGWRTIEIRDDGKRRARLHSTEREALRWVEHFTATIATAATRTITGAVEEYERHLTAKGNRAIDRTLWALDVFFRGATTLHELTPERCDGLYESLRTRPTVRRNGKPGPPYSNDSHRGALRETKTFLRWCVRQGYLVSSPAEHLKGVGRLRPRGKSLGKDGYRPRIKESRAWYAKALELAAAGDERAIAALLALLCGMRASEVVSRQIRDLDCSEVPGDVIHVEERKNGEDIAVEVPEPLRLALLKLIGSRESGYVFPWRDGHRARGFVINSTRAICKLAGIPPLTAHALRGLLATVSADRGMAGHLVAATLGNDEKVMAGHYAAPGAIASGDRRRGLAVIEGGKR